MFERFFDSLRDQGTRIGLKVKELYWIYHTVILLSISKYTRSKKKKKKKEKRKKKGCPILLVQIQPFVALLYIFYRRRTTFYVPEILYKLSTKAKLNESVSTSSTRGRRKQKYSLVGWVPV